MRERIVQEIQMLKDKHPSLQHGQNYDWVMIPDFQLPHGWNRQSTRLLFLIPNTYPHTAPDNFYVDAGLRTASGEMPNNYSEGASIPISGNWGCFSWHPETWKPVSTPEGGDNLVTFMRAVGIRLRELK